MTPITYISEQPLDYAKEIDACQSRADLVRILTDWRELAADALVTAAAMNEADWIEFKRGLKLERKGRFAGQEWADRFSDILMPATMFKASIIATKYGVPWGLAYLRMKEAEAKS